MLGTRPGTRPSNAMLPAGDAAIFAAGDDADGQIAEAADITMHQTSKPKSKKGRERERKKSGDTRKKNEQNDGADRGASNNNAGAAPALNAAMPVSEFEPVYCSCRSVSSGVVSAFRSPADVIADTAYADGRL